ncbi:MAG TPA: CehA/McbA family metallohydrolase [Caldilineae bacterium]|nr:CehA/McbA family metallohydrolase [Caldilineae bacterium]
MGGESTKGGSGRLWSLTYSRREVLRAALGAMIAPVVRPRGLEIRWQMAGVPAGRPNRVFLPIMDHCTSGVSSRWVPIPDVNLTEIPIGNASFGIARIEPDGPVVASDWKTFTLTYQVGERGFPVGARLEVRFPVMSTGAVFWSDVQVDDPLGAGYLVISSSNPEARFTVLLAERQRELHRLVFELSSGELRPGDVIYLTYGDTACGGKGVHVPEWGAPHSQRFFFLVDLKGSGEPVRLSSSPALSLIGGEPERLEVCASATARSGEPFRITVRAVDQCGNLVTSYRGLIRFAASHPGVSLPSAYRFTEEDQGAHTFTAVAKEPGVITITVTDQERSLQVESNPIGVDWLPGMYIYFGDLHVHTQLHRHDDVSDGTDLDYLYWYARDIVGLDFVAPTNHDKFLTDQEWRLTQRKAAKHNRPGRFVSFLAYEWTSSNASTWGRSNWGHRNVIYLQDDAPLFRCVDPGTDTLDGLFAALSDYDAIVIPHHPTDQIHPMNWEHHNPDFERLVEIYQVRGPQEKAPPGQAGSYASHPHPLSVQAALARGYRMGFTASTDNHWGQPSTSFRNGGKRDQRYDRPGIVAVIAPELTREALFRALQARRTYGTTLARLLVDFRMDGHFMGEEYETTSPPTAVIRVAGTAPIARIILVRDNEEIEIFARGKSQRIRSRGEYPQVYLPLVERVRGDHTVEVRWVDPDYRGEHFYYVRVEQEDGEMAWTSPIWVKGY